MKVLYLFSGSRKTFRGEAGVDYPDTQLYGLNHLGALGIEAEYKEWGWFVDRVFGFRIKHALSYFLTRGYDIVFGASLLYLMPFRRLCGSKATFVLLNIGLERTLTVHHGLLGALISWLVRGLDGVVCLAQFQKERLERTYPVLRGKVFFVPLGVDMRYYKPVYDNRKEYILSAGRDNGRDYETVVKVARHMPKQAFHLVCSRRNLSGITDIPENVHVFYDLPLAELHEKYKEAKLLLLATHNDGYDDGSDCSGQTVLLDSMASGLPVVATRKHYLADYAIEGEEVVVAESADRDSVERAIRSLDDVQLRRDMAARARARIEREFSTEKMSHALASIFSRVSARLFVDD